MFAYCLNNPVNNCDPSGQFAIAIPVFLAYAIAVVVTIALVSIAVSYYSQPSVQQSIATGLRDTGNAIVEGANKTKEAIGEITKPKVKTKEKTKAKINPNDPRVHHVVAQTEPLAQPARNVLYSVGMTEHSTENLLVLPQRFHAPMHTKRPGGYYEYINNRLKPYYGNEAGVLATLEELKFEITIASTLGIQEWDK